ncbi:GNAT family N-acetyltransferase [Microscilla marina]|uniref:Ribosomal-protein-alanine acetyltransferase n=1 Tax=Microscilla marina ATCC 23134 TaxID=313606 RepID=A1ZHF2_MICM2|nr:GNAT family N-acetyltransferase [Microscilla marina]EAY30421.1 ribosomal-protein-alanine acetyltransferase [Microscilla marina ATCC 23134]
MNEQTKNQINTVRQGQASRRASSVKVEERTPTPLEYAKLRDSARWDKMDLKTIEQGLKNSIFSVCATFENEVVGCGRVIGDGALYFYIQDVIVVPAFQKKGIGEFIMNEIMKFLATVADQNAFVGLMSAEGGTGFYERYGFEERPGNETGMLKIWRKKTV